MSDEAHEAAARMVASMLHARGEMVTMELVSTYADAVAGLPDFADVDLDRVRVARVVTATINVVVPDASALGNDADHIDWLAERRPDISWDFWDRYQQLLQSRKGFPPGVVRRTDDVTDDILGRLEDPEREGAWDRRGLVAGQVQSGKTSNYVGLTCKAADSGYKLIVVLAGIHNSLRSQTQSRLDEGFIGIDSQSRERIGVNLLPGKGDPIVHSLTTSADDGDFKLATANAATMRLGSDPLLVVIKKNATILRNLLEWVTSLNAIEGRDGRPIVEGIPLLLIDDEADSASINTKDKEADPTTINRLIRQILNGFEKVAYVGYTATPFANLYIDEMVDDDVHGRDLFPRSFIVALRPPSNYTGPSDMFGTSAIPELDRARTEGLPLVRRLGDHEEWIPDKHKKELVPGPIPASLQRALKSFLLATAARRSRGQKSHNSMLVHVTRYTAVQGLVYEQVDDWLSKARRELRYEGTDGDLREELHALWADDFEPTTRNMASAGRDFVDPSHASIDWADVASELARTVELLEVRRINGTAKDVLDYANSSRPLNVIAVGGDKLSRGLTLEGLTVSYYLRASKMYDTLMQMGRWFGYRPGYLDLCRLYTTHELASWYSDIAAASEELWSEFEAMAGARETPETFGLRVRSHPDGLLVTASGKMRHGESRSLSYATSLSETVVFPDEAGIPGSSSIDHKPQPPRQDYEHLCEFISSLDDAGHEGLDLDGSTRHASWRGVPARAITEFLKNLTRHPDARRARPDLIAKYVSAAANRGELSDWTVVLVSNTKRDPRKVGTRPVGYTTRARQPGESQGFRIKRILDPTHESLDLTSAERAAALAQTVQQWRERGAAGSEPTEPSGFFARRARSENRGLLLLYPLIPNNAPEPDIPFVGFGISLPGSATAVEVEYMVNNVYAQQEMEFADDA